MKVNLTLHIPPDNNKNMDVWNELAEWIEINNPQIGNFNKRGNRK